MITRRTFLQSGVAAAALASSARSARAADATPGITATEIKIGQTMPYSGPASAYGVIGRTEAAYFKMINDGGGVGGRKINFISLDDGYSPPKTVEQVRRLVEQEEVAFLFNTLGTPPNTAIRPYCNEHKIPQLFVATGAAKWDDPKHFPWTMGYNPSYETEAHIYAKHILATKPDAKIAVLYANDDFGKDYITGFKAGLGAKYATMVIKEATYENSEPTVDSQVVTLQGSGADLFFIVATPKFAAQAVRKSADLGWKATRYITNVSVSIATVLKPAGLDKSKGLITGGYVLDVTDPRFKDEPSLKAWKAFTDKYMSATAYNDANAAYAFGAAATMIEVIKQCGNDLSRENVMKEAANLNKFAAPLLYPGITINTSPTNFSPIRQLQLMTFNGTSWEAFGKILEG